MSSLVLGRYRLGPLLGRGGTASVYRADDVATGGVVAVKVVPTNLGLAARVRAEVRAAARLEHPGVVRLLDWGEDPHSFYLVSELVEGASVGRRLREGPPIADLDAVRLMAEVLEALDHAHRRGVVHRDVKPGNILVGDDGHALLTDFGVARLSGEAGLTTAGAVVGTVAYMAPEQASGEKVGPAADVYSASLVLLECLSGRNPVAGGSPAEVARRAAAGVVPSLSRLRPDLPRPLCRAVDAGLARQPGRRPPPQALAESLRRAGARVPRRPRALRLVPPVAGGLAGGALVLLALERGTSLEPAPRVTLAALAGAAFAFFPRAAAALTALLAVGLIAGHSIGLALVMAALGLVVLGAGWRWPRLLPAAGAAPALFALGLAPLLPAAAGLLRTWGQRAWAAGAGVVATLAWQILDGSDGLLFGSGPVAPAAPDLAGTNNPADVLERLIDPLRAHPEALAQGGVLVAAALAAVLVLRAPAGPPRLIALGAWSAALATALVLTSGDPGVALSRVLPALAPLAVWAVATWPRSARRAPSATLREPAT